MLLQNEASYRLVNERTFKADIFSLGYISRHFEPHQFAIYSSSRSYHRFFEIRK